MQRSYAIIWRRGKGPIYAGRFEFSGDGVRITGSATGRCLRTHQIPFAAIRAAEVTRARADRLRGLATMTLSLDRSAPLALATIDGPGRLAELASAVAFHLADEAA